MLIARKVKRINNAIFIIPSNLRQGKKQKLQMMQKSLSNWVLNSQVKIGLQDLQFFVVV